MAKISDKKINFVHTTTFKGNDLTKTICIVCKCISNRMRHFNTHMQGEEMAPNSKSMFAERNLSRTSYQL